MGSSKTRIFIGAVLVMLLVQSLLPTINPEACEPSQTATDRALPLEGKKIVIDPGHGLHYDNGNWNYQRPYCWGIVEDELTVEITSYLHRYLSDHTGADIFVTRELDKNAGNGISGQPKWQEGAWCHLRSAMGYTGMGSRNQDLTIRSDYANMVSGDIFISIHTNAGGGSARGTMTLWGGQDAGSGGGSPANDRALADKIHPPVVTQCGILDRGVWKDEDMSGFSLSVLRETDMPASLVEVAFHDNYDDNLLLHQNSFKEDAARGLVYGIFDYYSLPRPELELPNVVHDLTQATSSGNESGNPHLAELSGGELCLVWEETTGNGSQILYKRSTDRGIGWEGGKTLSSGNANSSSPTLTQTKDGTWFMAYVSDDGGSSRIYYRRSQDSGITWEGVQELTMYLPGSKLSSPRLFRTRYGTLWCVFGADGDQGGAYFCYSVDNGVSFNTPTRLSNGTGTAGEIYNTQTADGILWTVWSQVSDGKSSIWGTSSPSWVGWTEPVMLVEGNNFDAGGPALGDHDGKLYLFYTSDRTHDGSANGDIFYITSEDNGSTWGGEYLLTPKTDRDAFPSTLAASDGRLWVVFASENGTGDNSEIYLTNNVSHAGNRPPTAYLITENGSSFEILTPTVEFKIHDHDGNNTTGEIFWKQIGNATPAMSSPLRSGDNHTFAPELEDATWYQWWVVPDDGEIKGTYNPEFSSFYVDINYEPTVTLPEPENGSLLHWNATDLFLSVLPEDRDGDLLDVEIYLANATMKGAGEWNTVYRELNASGGPIHTRIAEGYISAGEQYYWKVSLEDENESRVISPVFTFSLEDAPTNHPPSAGTLKNRTVLTGENVRISAESPYDPEGGELYYEWWLFNVTGESDPYNATFPYLAANCEFSRSAFPIFLTTFKSPGSFLIHLNLSDGGAYLDPPAVTRLKGLIQVLENITPDPVTGGILVTGVVGTKTPVRCRANLSWGNDPPVNYTWIVSLEENSVIYHSPELLLNFTKAAVYRLYLLILTARGLKYEFARNITAIPFEDWDAAWSIVVSNAGPVRVNETVYLSLIAPSFLDEVPGVKWYLVFTEKPGLNITGGNGTIWSFIPQSAGVYTVTAEIELTGLYLQKELLLRVNETNSAGNGMENEGSSERSARKIDILILIFIVGIILAGSIWAVIIRRKLKGNEKQK